MDYVEAVKKLDKGQLEGAIFIYGDELYLTDYLLDVIKDKYLNEASLAFNYERLTMDKADFTRVKEASETLPFLAEKRIVEVRGLDLSKKGISKNKEFFTQLGEYIAEANKSTLLILASESNKFFKGSLYKKAKKYGHIVEMKRLNRKQLAGFAAKRLGENGIKISSRRLKDLLDILAYENEDLGLSLYDVVNELDKLAALADDHVTEKDLDEIYRDNSLGNIFQLTDSICKFESKKALDQYFKLDDGKDQFFIFYMIVRQFRNLINIALLKKKGLNKGQIRKVTGLSNFEYNKLEGFLRSYSISDLKKIYQEIYDTEVNLKSSRASFEENMLMLITKISARPQNS